MNLVYQVHAVPNVGDRVVVTGGEGPSAEAEVKEVVHYIDPTKRTHEIIVYYGERKGGAAK
jgi:hypothetical protein